MTVAELRIILEHLPPDLDVCVSSHWCQHIDTIDRMPANRKVHNVYMAIYGEQVTKPTVVLRSGTLGHLTNGTPWWEPAPPYQLRGSYRRRAELSARLNEFALNWEPE